MELQIMLGDAVGLADLQQQVRHHRQQHHSKERLFPSPESTLYGRASPLGREDGACRRKRLRADEPTRSSPLSSGAEQSSGPEDDPLFEWSAQEGERGEDPCLRRRRGLLEQSGLQAVAAAAEEAITSLCVRKRKAGGEEAGGKSYGREVARGAGEAGERVPRPATSQTERVDPEEDEAAAAAKVAGAAPCGRSSAAGSAPSANAGHNGWHVDDIDDNLAADLDGSLSGLEVDLTSSSSSYHMSESLLSLPTLTVFKQEVLSPTSQNDSGCTRHPAAINMGSGNGACGNGDSPREATGSPPSELQMSSEQRSGLHMLHYELCNERNNNNLAEQVGSSMESDRGKRREEIAAGGALFDGVSMSNRTGLNGSETTSFDRFHLRFEKSSNAEASEPVEDSRFQYVLAAATSIATKVNEETLTYLNQGQSYEIKLKKLGDLLAYRGKIFKSIIRICFHERRLQYAEREQLAAWQQSRPGDRVLEVDVPLSYGACEIVQDPCALNAVEFLWDPTKEVGVYIKVNCISTEFTPKKHGGEKGVPFRIQVETYSQATSPGESQKKSTAFVAGRRLHAAACQIKVFKLKGADRKHKQDREKILKRPPSEQEKYQPSYECTVLNDIHPDSVYLGPLTVGRSSAVANGASCNPSDNGQNLVPSQGLVKEEGSRSPGKRCVPLAQTSAAAAPPIPPSTPLQVMPKPVGPHNQSPSAVGVSTLTASTSPTVAAAGRDTLTDVGTDDFPENIHKTLNGDASAVATAQWLRSHRFSPYLHTFASFSGADLLRLSRDDLIQICGLADGIRLFNALHLKTIAPRLTLYIRLGQGVESIYGVDDACQRGSSDGPIYHALYLTSASCGELSTKVAHLAGVPFAQLHDVFVQGPSGIHVLLTDDVVQNLPEDSLFTVDVLKDNSGERFRLLLKSASC